MPLSPHFGQPDRLSVDPEALFVYGTLQFPDVLFALIDRIPDHSPAAAPGWRAAALPERVYPGLVPAPGTARGHLIAGVTAEEWGILDAFEGPMYELLHLELADGRHGWTYVWSPEVEVLPEDWSIEDFTNQHLPAYVQRCAAWRHHHERRQQVS